MLVNEVISTSVLIFVIEIILSHMVLTGRKNDTSTKKKQIDDHVVSFCYKLSNILFLAYISFFCTSRKMGAHLFVVGNSFIRHSVPERNTTYLTNW